jgi:hypothetical protein
VSYFLQVVAAIYAALFLAAVLGKADSWRAWGDLLVAVSPGWLGISVIKLGVPAVEAAVAVWLVIAPATGLLAAASLLGILAVAVLVVSLRHSGRPCACFGALMPSEIKRMLAARNAALAAIAAAAAVGAAKASVPGLTLAEITAVLLILGLSSLTLELRRFNRFNSRRFVGD